MARTVFTRVAVTSAFVGALLLGSAAASAADVPTATFENLRGQFLGFDPFTDPLSGINFYSFLGGLGASYFNSPDPTFPSLYHNNTVLVRNSPQANGIVSAGWDFSIHGALPTAGRGIDLDVLYTGETGIFNTQGAIYLVCYDSAGRIVARADTGLIPTSTTAWLQTHLKATAPTASIVSFDVIAHDLATSYDNFAVTVPEPAVASSVMTISLLLRRRMRA